MTRWRRYHIPVEEAPGRGLAQTLVLRDLDRCINCGTCIDSCLYGVHGRMADDPRTMAEPDSELCRTCFRCVGECPVGALTLETNPAYAHAGNALYTPKIISTILHEAATGAIPVFGAAYRGPFAGPGFDAMWTDMSEIVRPTRDGIHGREYISTIVDLGRRPPFLAFEDGVADLPRDPVRVPVPLLFDASTLPDLGAATTRAVAQAAAALSILWIGDADQGRDLLPDFAPHTVLRLTLDDFASPATWQRVRWARGAEIEYGTGLGFAAELVRSMAPEALLFVRVDAREYDRPMAQELLDEDVDAIHLHGAMGDGAPKEVEAFITALRRLHLDLVELGRRDEVAVVASGPIAAAEHVPKAVILGADLVAVDVPLLIAMERRTPLAGVSLPFPRMDLDEDEVPWGRQRLMNLVCAWRDQLLEILGAMGMREVRRLRGEVGRSIMQEEAQREAFADIRVVRGPEVSIDAGG
jgi:ferredoxin